VNREEKDEQIWLFATGALDPAEAESVRRLLAAGDPVDAAVYDDALATVSQLPLAIDPLSPPTQARQKLLERVAINSTRSSPMKKSPDLARWFAGVAAIVAIALGLISYHLFNQLKLHDDRAQATEEKLRTQLTRARSVLAMLSARNLQMVSLASSAPKSTAGGRVLWDKDRNQWHVTVFDLTPPPDGRVLELWFITADQKKIPGGTFTVNAQGNGAMSAKVPADLKNISLAAITDEPPGGMPQPTGQIQLAGKVE
jgi:anti-sigma-K factor RskA